MFKFLEQKLGGFVEVVGVDIRFALDGRMEVYWIHLRQAKGIVQIVSENSSTLPPSELQGFLPTNVPVAVVVDGKAFLHKKVEGGPTLDDQLLLERAIPNAKIKDFYIQQYSGFGGTWISLVRRLVVDELLEQWRQMKILPNLVGFGVFPLIHVTKILQPDMSLSKGEFGKYQIGFSNGLVDSIQAQDTENKEKYPFISSINLTQRNALAFATAFQLFMPARVESSIYPILENRNEAIQKHIFTKMGWGVLMFFFGILMINFIAFEIVRSKNGELRQKESLFAGKLDNLAQLQTSIREKEAFLKKTGWTSAPKLSFYSDRIASIVPTGILLSKLELHPVKVTTINSQKEVRIKTGEILIQGSSQNPTILNNWVLQLKYFEWINTIKVIDYQFDATKGLSNFTLLLEID